MAAESQSPQKLSYKGGLLPPPSAFHCPPRSAGTSCLSDYLQMDITTAVTQNRLRLEICPYASQVDWSAPIANGDIRQSTKREEEEDDFYYGFATAAPGTPGLVFGPLYNFTSIDFEVNFQLGGEVNHPDGGNVSSIMRHGWVKGLLFEYILLYCPPLPTDFEVGGQVGYSLHTHTDATGATVAVAEVRCLPDRFFLPPYISDADVDFNLVVNGTVSRLSDYEPLKSQMVLRCDHHRRRWMPDLPNGGCMTRESIDATLKALVKPKSTARSLPNTTQAVEKKMRTNSVKSMEVTTNNTAAAMTLTTTTPEAPVLVAPLNAPVKSDGNNKSIGNGSSLSHGSSAAMGAIFGFILCLIVLLIIVFIFRQRLSRLVRSKLATSNTLPGRFPGSGMFMNTLSGSLTFSRHRKGHYFSPSRHPNVIMSQSAVSIPHHPQQWLNGSSVSVVKPTSAAVSLGNLHTSKPSLSRLPPPSMSPTQAKRPMSDLELGLPDAYGLQQTLHNNVQQQPGPPSSVTTPNSTSLSTQRQTLLSADTVTTNISAGQPSPTITMGYCGASADRLAEGFVEPPDVNQVFSATLPWKSKPQGGVAGGLKRLSTFIRSAMSGSSASFHGNHSNHGNHHHQQMITPGVARRQNFASFASSPSSAANSAGLLSSAQSRSSYTSDVTIQPGEYWRRMLNKQRRTIYPFSILRLSLPSYTCHCLSCRLRLVAKRFDAFDSQGHGTDGKTATLNMDTYLEPIDGVDSLGRSDTNPAVEDLSVTELISGGTFSEDSDTGHQASWPSISAENCRNGGPTNAAIEGTSSTKDGSGGYGESSSSIAKAPGGAPIAVSDPTVSLGDASFEEDTCSTADYFTYDEGHRSHSRRHDRVIRRPRLSPPSPRSRPLSEAMLSNHYYDKSELLNVLGFTGDSKGDKANDCLQNLPFRPTNSTSRPTSVGIYSNDDEDLEEDSSLYEAVDRRKRKLDETDALPPPPSPPSQTLLTPTASQKNVEALASRCNPSGDGVNARYQHHRGSTKVTSTNASTSTLIAELSPLSRSSASRSPSPIQPVTGTPHTVPYANLSNL
ncbi:unnamed protein product [Hydatigera taeniaeformis]|uniref:Uncharacterized protein n=1 Tax=Hydatigena taeniaeformis TaxID=6205 RepID=A0A3P7FS27_HYDTA|nr:unnamed protein product [Hydatigera taeniaeformis]